MANIFIIHGVEGYPEENWFPWLKKALEQEGHRVIVPQFPTPAKQTLEEWMKVFLQYKNLVEPEAILVGHSLGAPFLLSIIERMSCRAAFFVAGFTGKAGNRFDDSMKTFSQKTFDWEKIRNNCRNFAVFHSDNDPYIKPKKAEELARLLGVEVTFVKDAGHFNSAAGYDKFDLLLEKIKMFL